MKKTIFEEMGGIYIRHGDYLIKIKVYGFIAAHKRVK